MKKRLSPDKLLLIFGIVFATVLVLINVFFDFVPHTVKTESLKQSTTEFSTYSTKNVNNKNYTIVKDKVININTATVEQLCTLKMIGETRANAIVKYREKNGLFKKKSDITNVYGIGEKTYEKIKDNICVN